MMGTMDAGRLVQLQRQLSLQPIHLVELNESKQQLTAQVFDFRVDSGLGLPILHRINRVGQLAQIDPDVGNSALQLLVLEHQLCNPGR